MFEDPFLSVFISKNAGKFPSFQTKISNPSSDGDTWISAINEWVKRNWLGGNGVVVVGEK
jgi:hypothetical protein